MKLLEESPGQDEAIRRVVIDAFGRDEEAALVDALRRDGDLVISVVAEVDGVVCGHVALSRLNSPARAVALAPVAVAKAQQSRGIGSALIRHAIELARARDYEIVFVVGEPEYYRRFGFSAEAASAFACPYAGPYFMALPLTERSISPAAVTYARAFADLE